MYSLLLIFEKAFSCEAADTRFPTLKKPGVRIRTPSAPIRQDTIVPQALRLP
jgi:hypothetical protein